MATSSFSLLLVLFLFLTTNLLVVLSDDYSSETLLLLPSSRREGANPTGPSCPAPDPTVYNLPVIGIVSHPGDGAGGRINNASAASYIAASYVKFVESAGARVIPLIYNEAEDTLIEKLNLVNGVLFTGGSVKTGLYYDTIKKVFQIILEKNDAGQNFPLLATCLGFELLSMIISKDTNILETFSAENQASTLQFPSYAGLEGSVFEKFSPDLIRKLSTECLVMQNHRFGVSPKRMRENDGLSSFFKILTTTADENGKVYVSSVQAYKYPVIGLQWHPEKNVYEWVKSTVPHSEDAVLVAQNVANYFIRKARKSSNRPAAEKVLDNLIYNYKPTYAEKFGSGFDEVYVFS